MNHFDDFKPWLDEWLLIGFKGENGDLDFGDCVHNEYTRLYCQLWTGHYNAVDASRLNAHLIVQGIPRRHPNPSKWYSGTNRTSRDALTPYLCWLVSCQGKNLQINAFKQLAAQHAKRAFLFAWNTRRNFQYPTLQEHLQKSTPDVQWNYSWKMPDICGPDIWALYLRGFAANHAWTLPVVYPLLNLLDLQLLAHSLLLRWKFHKNAEVFDYDRRNSTLKLHLSAKLLPTIFSKFAWKIYQPIGAVSSLKWWTKAGEPPMHKFVLSLFKA